ncbi:MAG: nicotinate-nucleotide diphosphorylase (carboxylating) [Gemmatimonadetes bacterium GWC2_71_10]|nr:MAG: nicotinate-nucleotide diphosphorylase (carboxylating) [Gemmatimonadetes bacterium GWC2_71_10]
MADFTEPVRRALAEDRASEDVTSALLKARHREDTGTAARRHGTGLAEARFVAEERVVVCGVPAIVAAVTELDATAAVTACAEEGAWAEAGATIAVASGDAAALLSAERVALNFVQRLSGIATLTRRCVEAVAGTGARITHTRKTTPGLRDLEIYAVVAGGGVANRASLAGAIMWKDNHWGVLEGEAQRHSGTAAQLLKATLARAPQGVEIVVEVESFAQLDAALGAGVRHVLVDNQTPDGLAGFRRRAGPGVTIQASGGITLATVRAYAEAGADLIAMGALTHSAPSVGIRCDITRSTLHSS